MAASEVITEVLNHHDHDFRGSIPGCATSVTRHPTRDYHAENFLGFTHIPYQI